MTVLGIVLTWAVLHMEYRVYRASRPRPTLAEDRAVKRMETETYG